MVNLALFDDPEAAETAYRAVKPPLDVLESTAFHGERLTEAGFVFGMVAQHVEALRPEIDSLYDAFEHPRAASVPRTPTASGRPARTPLSWRAAPAGPRRVVPAGRSAE
ncbi:hypothetical protein [Streptomyces brasiliensis]|uniref:Uncharacterized protein n=1 Tax=Streptomyces brasiliensis TaxID=1954 RepID=A0A917KYN3_9ACTN|nr:hypothetical protein [Streptomyces brasiliensis]GGJ33537.1 hypothetical protein GCM10010121_050910 [Streptomyces brasiliensis]